MDVVLQDCMGACIIIPGWMLATESSDRPLGSQKHTADFPRFVYAYNRFPKVLAGA